MTPAIEFVSATLNLLVSDTAASVDFYRDVLGFGVERTVPDEPPFVFVWLKRGGVELFLNDVKPVTAEFPALRAGDTSTLFVIIDNVDALYDQLSGKARMVMPPTDRFYGMREIAVLDPDGYLLTFAHRISGE